MLRKLVSFALVFALLLGIVMIPGNTTRALDDVSKEEGNITLRENNLQVTSETEVEGTVVKCTYDKLAETYDLYLDDVRYNLNVDIYDGCAMVYMNNRNDAVYGEQVVAQSVAAIALSAGYWAPAIVAAAKVVIASVITATLAVATYYSAELIATTINGVKTKAITKSDLHTKAKTATRALDLVKTSKKNNKTYYYAAYLYNGQVMVGNQISYSAAVSRLKRGYDVFASNLNAALAVAKAASTNGRVKFDKTHKSPYYIFPHYHPYGRKWVKDSSSMPHCWFPPL